MIGFNKDSKNQELQKVIAAARGLVVALALAGAFLLPLVVAGAEGGDSCVDCHSKLQGRLLVARESMKDDIHFSRMLSCASCHGGDPTTGDQRLAKSREKGYSGAIPKKDIPALCSKCHSSADFMKAFKPSLRVDQEREYSTSVHGQRLRAGDQNVATCASCHGHHGVRRIDDPASSVYPTNVAETCANCHSNANLMGSYGIAADQFAKYKSSVHARALYERQDISAPTCNDCHGNHGATPPGIASVANICGQCHVRQSELFRASLHKPAFDSMQVGECVQCHSNHDIVPPNDEMVGVGQGSLCIGCHVSADKGRSSGERIRELLRDLAANLERSNEILGRAERAGMEVSRPRFELSAGRDALTNARVVLHSFSPDEVEKVARPGLDAARTAYGKGEEALAEISFRRKGLGVSLFFIVFLAVLIYLKIRQIESPA